jgi:SAM-dependent methyltransferase
MGSTTLSLYEFGGTETAVRHIQKRFVNRFRGHSPVLDIGCGRGVFLDLLRSAGIDAFGIDHSSEAVQSSARNGFQIQRADCLEFLSETKKIFGGIFCSHVIEHLEYRRATELISLCRQTLRQGGKLVIVTPNPMDLSVMGEIFWLDPTHVRPYPAPLLCRMLDSAGFKIESTETFHSGWRCIGRRNLPAFYFKRLLLGKHFGCENTAVTAIAT